MRSARLLRAAAVGLALVASCATPVSSTEQQNVLPKPEQPFEGKIGRTAAESTPDFPKPLESARRRAERPAHSSPTTWDSPRPPRSAGPIPTPELR